MATVNINLIQNKMFVDRLAAEISNIFDNLVNSCSTFTDLDFAKVLCQKFIAKDNEYSVKYLDPMLQTIFKQIGLNIKVEDLSVKEYREIQDLVMCHAAVYICLLDT